MGSSRGAGWHGRAASRLGKQPAAEAVAVGDASHSHDRGSHGGRGRIMGACIGRITGRDITVHCQRYRGCVIRDERRVTAPAVGRSLGEKMGCGDRPVRK